MITLVGDFRQYILDLAYAGVLLGRQRLEQGLLLVALSGYASVYCTKMNWYFQCVWAKCTGRARGARE